MNKPLRTTAILLSTLLALVISNSVRAEITTLTDAINKAGFQGMLSQRIVKDYCLAGMGVEKEASNKELKKSTGLLNSQLDELKAFSSTDEVKLSVDRAAALWIPFLESSKVPATKESCKSMSKTSDELTLVLHELELALAQASGTESGNIINVSSRQRMLSQRFAKLQAMFTWELGDTEITESLDTAKLEFQAAQVKLFQSKLNTPEIKNLLIMVNRHYKPFKKKLGQRKDEITLAQVIKNTELILLDMDTVTSLYQKDSEAPEASESPESQ